MKNLIGIVLAVTGFSVFGTGDAMLAMALIVIGSCLLLMGNSKRSGNRSAKPTATPPVSQTYWSPMTNKSYSSYAEMKHAEDVHLANVYSDPRFR